MYFKQVHINGYDRNMCYFIGDEETREVAVVDPCDLQTLNKVIKEDNLKVVAILLTHHHHDHTGGCEEMQIQTGAPVYAHNDNVKLQNLSKDVARALHHGDKIQFGNVKIEVLATPGHSSGSACYLVNDKLITGDTLFIEGCGRCDLEGGNPKQMYNSLYKIIGSLPDYTEIYPAHDYGSVPHASLAHEKKHNRFFQCKNEEEFVNMRMR